MTQTTSNPFSWGGLINQTAQGIFADINNAASVGSRYLINDYFAREFDGALGANPLGPNVPGDVARQNASELAEVNNYLGTGLKQSEVLALGGAGLALLAIALIVR